MLRDYGICIKEGYTAEEYASAWGYDLYHTLFDSAIDFFWSENYNDAKEWEQHISITELTERDCMELCHEAYIESYNRYKREHINNEEPNDEPFEEWEIDDTSHEVLNMVITDLTDNLNELKKYGANRE